MTRPGTFQPGQSGNPAGRPPKKRALTTILEQAGNRTVLEKAKGQPEKMTARKRILARLIWQLATEGKATMPDGETKIILDPGEWKSLVQWIYTHIDGPQKAEVDITSGGKPLNILLDWGEHADNDPDDAKTA